MKDKYFLDTDIFVYAFDKTNLQKSQIANELIKTALKDKNGFISYQVIQEFINVATRKFAVPLTEADCRLYLDKVLSPLCHLFSNLKLYEDAIDIMERWKISFYDSLIISAAIALDCRTLFSEDLQNNQKIQTLTVKNPFAK